MITAVSRFPVNSFLLKKFKKYFNPRAIMTTIARTNHARVSTTFSVGFQLGSWVLIIVTE